MECPICGDKIIPQIAKEYNPENRPVRIKTRKLGEKQYKKVTVCSTTCYRRLIDKIIDGSFKLE